MKKIDYKQIVKAIREAMVDYQVSHDAEEERQSEYIHGKIEMTKWIIGLIDKVIGHSNRREIEEIGEYPIPEE